MHKIWRDDRGFQHRANFIICIKAYFFIKFKHILLLIKGLKTELCCSIMRILVTLPDLTIGQAGKSRRKITSIDWYGFTG